MKLHYILIGITVISLILLGIMDYIGDLGDGYSTTADLSSLENTSKRLQQQKNLSNQLNKDLTNVFLNEDSVSSYTVPYVLIKSMWTSAKLYFAGVLTLGVMIIEIQEGLEAYGIALPGWFIGSMIALITFTVVAIFIYAIFKWKFED